jgi:hypothetical protein
MGWNKFNTDGPLASDLPTPGQPQASRNAVWRIEAGP